MDERLRVRTLEALGPPPEAMLPTMEFMAEMHQKYGTELDALVGRSALDRPYSERQLTIAERYYRDVLGRKALFADDLQEVNRTLMNVAVQRALTDPDARYGYDFITNCQENPATRLTWDSYSWLRDFASGVLYNDERQIAMEAGLIDADLGKSELIREDMKVRFGKEFVDHDRLLLELMLEPLAARRWTPGYYDLPLPSQQTIFNNYASGYHTPQGLQGEVPSVKLVKFSEQSQEDQMFGLLLGFLDIAGTEGDTVQNGSMTLIEPVVTVFRMQVEAVQAGARSGLTGQERALFIDETYYRSRAALIGVDYDAPHGRDLARLGSSLRCTTENQFDPIFNVLTTQMLPEDRGDLLELLAYTGFEPNGHAWVMYLPDFVRRYAEKLRDHGVSVEEAWDIALTGAAGLYRTLKDQVDLSPGVVVVAGDLIRDFEKDPSIPLRSTVRLNRINDTEYNAAYVPQTV